MFALILGLVWLGVWLVPILFGYERNKGAKK